MFTQERNTNVCVPKNNALLLYRKVIKEIAVGDLEPDETLDAMHEANLLRNLDHPNIVKFHDSFIDGNYFCLVTEYCEVYIYTYMKIYMSIYFCCV